MSATDSIKQTMEAKHTDELLAIWTENNREHWSDAAFQAVKEALLGRGVELPQQKAIPQAVACAQDPVGKRRFALRVRGVILLFVGILIGGVRAGLATQKEGQTPPVIQELLQNANLSVLLDVLQSGCVLIGIVLLIFSLFAQAGKRTDV